MADLEVTTADELLSILGGVQTCGTLFETWRFDWQVARAHDEHQRGWNLQCSFERPDVEGHAGETAQGFGRKWFVAEGTPITGVVFTAWLAMRQVVEHELMEAFTVTVEGEQVRLLDPHKTLADLAVGSRRT